MTAPPDPCARVARQIAAFLTRGLIPGRHFQRHALSLLGAADRASVMPVLRDENDDAHTGLLLLLFSPQTQLQLELEPHLCRDHFRRRHAPIISAALLKSVRKVAIRFDDGDPAVLPFSAMAAEQIVAGLNITWRHPPNVRAAAQNCLPAEDRQAVYVRLRNAQVPVDPLQADLLIHIFESWRVTAPARFELLDFATRFLSPLGPQTDLYLALMTLKKTYFKALQQALRFTQRLATSNMETLMLQGVQAPALKADVCRRQLRRIDALAMTAFGRCEHFEPPTLLHRGYHGDDILLDTDPDDSLMWDR